MSSIPTSTPDRTGTADARDPAGAGGAAGRTGVAGGRGAQERPGAAGGRGAQERPGAAARQEAERLVAAGIAAVSLAADRIGAPSRPRGGAAAAGFDALGDLLFGPSYRRHSIANDSPECCRCPVCRVIAAARRPDPDLVARLTTGVGDVVETAARMVRLVTGGNTAR
ncbi:MAG TPA: hypothetical protein VKY81_04600 [Natronosporangium sp.]|nr:hypothetical protein [Natronosporangium sp.]